MMVLWLKPSNQRMKYFFHCDEILAINPEIYLNLVLPLLQNKKLPSRFSPNFMSKLSHSGIPFKMYMDMIE